MSSAAVLGYTGECSPPSCEMTFKAVSQSDMTKVTPNLSLTVTVTGGVKKQNTKLTIERPGEGDVLSLP